MTVKFVSAINHWQEAKEAVSAKPFRSRGRSKPWPDHVI
jgi:hypothetical protein